jgi:hypothetical protein
MLRHFLFGITALAVGCCAEAASAPTAVAAAAPSSTGCNLQMVANPTQWRVNGVDVFAVDPTFASFDMELINNGGSACTGRLALDTRGAPFGLSASGGRNIPYSVIDHATGADLTPRNGHSPFISSRVVTIPPGGNTLARFDVLFPSSFETDGTFSQQLLVQLTDPSTGGEVIAEQPVALVADVPSSATIALSGDFTRVGGAADVDLGELSQGLVKVPLVVHVKSTRAYQITSASENGGKLVLAGTSWSIPYKLSFDGTTVDPQGGAYRSSPGDSRRVDNLQLGFVIVGNTDVEAGRYSDVVTLDIALN